MITTRFKSLVAKVLHTRLTVTAVVLLSVYHNSTTVTIQLPSLLKFVLKLLKLRATHTRSGSFADCSNPHLRFMCRKSFLVCPKSSEEEIVQVQLGSHVVSRGVLSGWLRTQEQRGDVVVLSAPSRFTAASDAARHRHRGRCDRRARELRPTTASLCPASRVLLQSVQAANCA